MGSFGINPQLKQNTGQTQENPTIDLRIWLFFVFSLMAKEVLKRVVQ